MSPRGDRPLVDAPVTVLGPRTIPVLGRGDVVARIALPIGEGAVYATALALSRELQLALVVHLTDEAHVIRVRADAPDAPGAR